MHCLRARAEQGTPELRDQVLQLLVLSLHRIALGGQRDNLRPQRGGVIGQIIAGGGHA